MSRNGSGTYSVPNSFSSGTTIASADVNTNFTDVGSEITNSLPRDGQAAMTGQLKAANGTAVEPGISFGADTNTGFFRKSADVIGVAVGGAEVGTIDAAGIKSAAGNLVTDFPSGTRILFQQAAAPTGWTKVTDPTYDDRALRITTGSIVNGGTTAFTTVFSARTIAQANLPNVTLSFSGTTTGQSQDHNHAYGDDNPLNIGGGASGSIQEIGRAHV